MSIKHFSLIAISAAALSACVGNIDKPQPATIAHGNHADMARAITKEAPNGNFVCQNGMKVKTQYLADATGGNNRLVLVVDQFGLGTTIPQVVAASGEKYEGNGFWGRTTTWHEKRGEAFFGLSDQQGKSIETLCSNTASK